MPQKHSVHPVFLSRTSFKHMLATAMPITNCKSVSRVLGAACCSHYLCAAGKESYADLHEAFRVDADFSTDFQTTPVCRTKPLHDAVWPALNQAASSYRWLCRLRSRVLWIRTCCAGLCRWRCRSQTRLKGASLLASSAFRLACTSTRTVHCAASVPCAVAIALCSPRLLC